MSQVKYHSPLLLYFLFRQTFLRDYMKVKAFQNIKRIQPNAVHMIVYLILLFGKREVLSSWRLEIKLHMKGMTVTTRPHHVQDELNALLCCIHAALSFVKQFMESCPFIALKIHVHIFCICLYMCTCVGGCCVSDVAHRLTPGNQFFDYDCLSHKFYGFLAL